MPKSRIPSPARSHTGLVTPRRDKPRGPRSVGSPARSNTSMRLTSVIQNFKDKNMESFHLSPVNSRHSVLNDNTDIEEPKRNSWWKKLNDTSRDIMEVLENDKQEEAFNVIEEYMDVEVLSQEKKNRTLHLPDSSDGESISSIIVPQRKLFTQKENRPKSKFAQLLGTRDSMATLNKTNNSVNSEKTIVGGTKKLFGQSSKLRSKPAFPTELLNFSPDKTINKTTEEIKGQVRNLFGNRAGVKRKNNFADFIASESEDEPEIQPKVFRFQKTTERQVVRPRDPSPALSATTDIDMDDWKHLPSSTMVQTQLEAMITDSPAIKARLSKLSEGKESEAATVLSNKTKQSNKSVASKEETNQIDNAEQTAGNQNGTINISVTSTNKSKFSSTKPSLNKSKTLHMGNKSVQKSIVNEAVPENNERNEEQDEQNQNYSANKSKYSDKSVTTTNKSKLLASKTSLNKSKTSPKNNKSAQKSTINKIVPELDEQEMDDDEDNRLALTYSDEEPNEEGNDKKQEDEEAHKSKEKEDGNQVSKVEQENEEGPEVHKESQEMKDGNQDSEEKQENKEGPEVHEESQEMEDENQDSQIEQENEEGPEVHKESQEMEDENQDSEVEQENEEGPEVHKERQQMKNGNQDSEVEQENEEDPEVHEESQEIEDENQDSEVEKGNEDGPEVHDESQEMEDENQDSEVEQENEDIEDEEENKSQEVESEFEQDNRESENEEDEQNESQEVESDVPVETEENDEPEENEEINEQTDRQEIENQIQEINNESQEIDNGETDESEVEEENDSEEVIDKSVCEQHKSNEVMDESVDEKEVNGEESDNNISQEEITGTEEGTPNVTHDTTGRNRKKDESNVKSLEEILHNEADEIESFTANNRNTSIRRTSMMKSRNIKPSLAPARESTGLSEGTNSSAGSGWDSHRTTRKTLRKTFGRDFTPRKSLRALVMEKSAKRHTAFTANDVGEPEANSTELPGDTRDAHEFEDPHDVWKRTRQTTLETYLQNLKKESMEERKKVEEEVRNSLKATPRLLASQYSLNPFMNPFNVPSRPIGLKRVTKPAQKPKKTVKSTIPLDELSQEFLEDMKYKPPKRFKPRNAAWVTKRLYKYLETKLEPKYDYKARIRAEKLVETLYNFTKEVRKHTVAPSNAVEVLKHELARLKIVRTHFEFYHFCHEYLPREVRIKVNPDVVNNIPLPRDGIFADILSGNTGQE